MPNSALLQPLSERFIAAAGHIEKLLSQYLGSVGNTGLREASEALISFGREKDSIFDLRREELRQIASAQKALEASRSLSVRLGDEVAELVLAAQRGSSADALRSIEAIENGKVFIKVSEIKDAQPRDGAYLSRPKG